MSSARSHERSVCAIPIVLASKRERRGAIISLRPRKAGHIRRTWAPVNCCLLAPWHFFGSPPLNLGLNYGRLQGDSPNFLGVRRSLGTKRNYSPPWSQPWHSEVSKEFQLLYLSHNMVSSTVPYPCLILCSSPIRSSAAMLHFSALAFLRGRSPKLGPDLWALTGGTRLIPPNFLGVVRRLFRGRTDHILRHAGRPQWEI